MIKLYLEVEGGGVNLKLPGVVEIGGAGPHSAEAGLRPGQLRTSFEDAPQQPVSSMREVALNGGAQASLATQLTCGGAVDDGSADAVEDPPSPVQRSSLFVSDYDGAGSGCPSTLPFAPTASAGVDNLGAGDETDFRLDVSRSDREANLGEHRGQNAERAARLYRSPRTLRERGGRSGLMKPRQSDRHGAGRRRRRRRAPVAQRKGLFHRAIRCRPVRSQRRCAGHRGTVQPGHTGRTGRHHRRPRNRGGECDVASRPTAA